MNISEDAKLVHRVQTLGRSIVTNVFQLFRSAEIYEENNDIFLRIAESMRNHLEECFRYLNSCNLQISNYNLYISGQRIYIDFGILDSVNSLSRIFKNGGIGGLMFLQDCLDKRNLIKGLLAFRETLVVDQRKGVDAIKKGLIDRHSPFIVPLKLDEQEVRVAGLRDEANAKKFAMRNAIKLSIFLEQMHHDIESGSQLQMTIVYRIALNLIRVLELHPSLGRVLLFANLPDPKIKDQFMSSLLLLIVLIYLKVERQVVLNAVVDSLFHKVADMLEVGRHLSPRDKSIVGATKLLETRFINQSFFYRLNYAFHTPLVGEDKYELDMTRLLKAIVALVRQLKSKEMVQTAIINLVRSQSKEIHKPSVLLLANALGILTPGQIVILDSKTPAVIRHWSTKNDETDLQVTTLNPEHPEQKDMENWHMRIIQDWERYFKRLSMVPPTVPSPNPIRTLLME